MKVETNLADHYRKDLIEVLCRFSKYNDNRPYRDLTRDNIITFLETYRRSETQDPLHKVDRNLQHISNPFIAVLQVTLFS
jgi:hypothetical protein